MRKIKGKIKKLIKQHTRKKIGELVADLEKANRLIEGLKFENQRKKNIKKYL